MPKKKKTAKKPVAAKKPKPKSAPKKKPKRTAKKTPSLGRPKVTLEEKLFLLFREDFHARQIFEFLRAATVRDLETWSPEEIVRLLSKPIRESVNRIRLKLAECNRCLKGDEEFAIENAPQE